MGAGAGAAPRLETHEAYVTEVTAASDLDLADPLAVFGFVFRQLPPHVTVYPTENYYYFAFHLGGVRYTGNIRLQNELRDRGQVHFAYSAAHAPWKSDDPLYVLLLTPTHGLTVERQDPLTYQLGFAGKTVTFSLNDLSGVVPPAGAVRAGERYLGPIFDESAIRFFLVFDPALKAFRYILDESVPVADVLAPLAGAPRILIGKRTGFAFYRDHRSARKVLIGVNAQNADLNTYFDGPFDQLPDNFIDGDALRDAILQVEPGLRGRIDRYGGFADGALRYGIAPYRHYEDVRELVAVDRCAARATRQFARYDACFDSKKSRPTPARARPGVKRSPPSAGRPSR